ncbi:hypothetical protein EDB80DRAFT_691211 [Ilyonectria destructans]|nr:hypothetical protein EDB80DRAFT_691211 [Ilyonectria destructans]
MPMNTEIMRSPPRGGRQKLQLGKLYNVKAETPSAFECGGPYRQNTKKKRKNEHEQNPKLKSERPEELIGSLNSSRLDIGCRSSQRWFDQAGEMFSWAQNEISYEWITIAIVIGLWLITKDRVIVIVVVGLRCWQEYKESWKQSLENRNNNDQPHLHQYDLYRDDNLLSSSCPKTPFYESLRLFDGSSVNLDPSPLDSLCETCLSTREPCDDHGPLVAEGSNTSLSNTTNNTNNPAPAKLENRESVTSDLSSSPRITPEDVTAHSDSAGSFDQMDTDNVTTDQSLTMADTSVRLNQHEENMRKISDAISILAAEHTKGSASRVPFNDKFDAHNVTRFLRRYNHHMDGQRVSEDDRNDYIDSYITGAVASQVRRCVESLPWEQAQANLLDEFKYWDEHQGQSFDDQLFLKNTERLNEDYTAIMEWLNDHAFLCRKVDPDHWEQSVTQSKAIFNAMPIGIQQSLCESLDKSPEAIGSMPYSHLYEKIKSFIDRRISIRARSILRQPLLQKLEPTELQRNTQQNRAPPTVPPPTILKKGQDKTATTDQMAQLIQGIEQLKINMSQGNERAIQMQKQIDHYLQRNANASTKRGSNTHSVSFDQSIDEDNIRVNAFMNNRSCFYCGKTGHNTKTCFDLDFDKSHGHADYDAYGGCAWIGRTKERLIPPYLVSMFRRESCIRRLVILWIERFPNSLEFSFLKKMKERQTPDSTYKAKDNEKLLIDEFMERNTDHPYKLPPMVGFDAPREALPYDEGTSQDKSAVNVVLMERDDEPFDQAIMINPLEVAANERKRQRVEDNENPEGVGLTSKGNAIPMNQATTEETPTQTQGRSQVSFRMEDARNQTTDAIAKIVEGIQRAKIGCTIKDLCVLNPTVAHQVAATFNDLAEGVKNVEWVDPISSLGKERNKAHTSLVTLEVPNLNDEYFDKLEKKLDESNATVVVSLQNKPVKTPRQLDFGDFLISTKETQECITVEKPQPLSPERPSTDQLINIAKIHQPFISSDRVVCQSQDLPRIQVRLNAPDGPPLEALVDTGSEGNIISEDLIEQCGITYAPVVASTTSYSNDRVPMLGVAEVKLYLGNVVLPQRMYVAPKGKVLIDFILGMPFVRSAKVSFDHTAKDGNMLMKCQLGDVRIITPAAGSIRWETPRRRAERYIPSVNTCTVSDDFVLVDDDSDNRDECVSVLSDCSDDFEDKSDTAADPSSSQDRSWVEVEDLLKSLEVLAYYIEEDDDSIKPISCGTVIDITRTIM